MVTAAVTFFSAASGTTAVSGAALGSLAASGAIATAPTLGAAGLFSSAGLAAGAATLTSASSVASLLSGGLTIASSLSSMQAGQQQQAALNQQAMMSDLQARQELLKGQKDHVDALTELNDALAHNTVAGFARGLTGSGSVGQASLDAIKKAEFEIDIDRGSAEIRAGAKRMQGDQFRLEGRAKKTAGQTQALSTVAQHGLRVLERGDF